MSEIDDAATVYSEAGVVTRLMPEFWLIMQLNSAAVDILYQHRYSYRLLLNIYLPFSTYTKSEQKYGKPLWIEIKEFDVVENIVANGKIE